MTDFMKRRTLLKTLLAGNRTLQVPGCSDCVSARLVQQAGFPVVYVGSYATAASRLGLPDAGLVSMTEMVQHADSIANCVSIPVIADAENGFNNAANIWQTVRAFEKAGVSAIHIEDHEFGKHTNVKPALLPCELMVEKIRAALEARQDDNFLIIARTDVAWAWKDIDEMVKRVNAFTGAGADLIFPAGLAVDKLKPVRNCINGKVVLTNRPGASLHDEEVAGADVVLYYSFSLYAAYYGVQSALKRLRVSRDVNSLADILATAEEFENFIGYPDFVEKAKRYGLTK